MNLENPIRIVKLGPSDWQELKALRLEALRSDPAAFSSTYEETLTRPDQSWIDRLTNPASVTLMARHDERPIGMVGALFGSDDGAEHVAVVVSMFVQAAHRGQGIGRLLLLALMEEIAARPGVKIISLSVKPTREAACRLYRSLGLRVVDRADLAASIADDDPSELIMQRTVR